VSVDELAGGLWKDFGFWGRWRAGGDLGMGRWGGKVAVLEGRGSLFGFERGGWELG